MCCEGLFTLTYFFGVLGMVKNPSKIKNKTKRAEVYAKYKQQKSRVKRVAKEERLKEAEALGENAPPKQVPRMVDPNVR
jgi:hypothetical protein